MAISHLGIGTVIQAIDSEKSEEANACRQFYDVAKSATLKDHNWSFATKISALALVASDPTEEWSYAYRVPTDCLITRRLLSGMRQDTLSSEVPYRVVPDNSGLLIYTDMADASLEYTYDVKQESLFPSDLSIAFSFRLAAYVSPRITAGDPFSTKQEMLGQYQFELSRAIANDNENGALDKLPESEFIKARS